ncbi:sphingosine hydroxylase [Punctularia strigosozonata HHB-11173 SS5]|uniref:sphingosine hydroxylase n=1 Tax=Punctularia strigosozonata (strain HHB-11173) TaxID=741275 RepID=UPI00044175EB|nr:sphingosine hydroxylase [Punctularia strigosozonata HHB-11173 SS5]EIN06024.1 sphingosine hydroxylase [Punctularia strigosozonata HHB-11173 SS5]
MNNSQWKWQNNRTALSAHPIYFKNRPELIPGIPDHALVLAVPVIAYWAYSLFFHALDMSGWKWLDKYRIHDSAEVKLRNRATRLQVVRAVIFQQVIQTILGVWWMDGAEDVSTADHAIRLQTLAPTVERVLRSAVGNDLAHSLMDHSGADILYVVYWWAIPIAQFLFAMFIIDTWQYFLHRAMHVNKFLYKHLHSVHHRLYVPYAFGALYNHPLEGFLLDSLGAAIAEALSCMTTRQAMLLFGFSTLKTVDDHCGYRLPFDPLQWISTNDADYHDIHHQIIGIKSNFSQPFFVHWDVILGTRMTREDITLRRQKALKHD